MRGGGTSRGGSAIRGRGRGPELREQRSHLEVSRGGEVALAGVRPRPGRRSQVGRTRRLTLPRLVQMIAHGVLLVVAARVALMAWDAVSVRRAELFQKTVATEAPFPRISASMGGAERWMDAGLAESIGKAVAPSVGTAGIYVRSLNNGASAMVDENLVFPSASLFKVPILVELLRQHSMGMLDMNALIKLQPKHWSDGAGVLQAQIGKEYPVHELVDLMIQVSDNVAALALLDLVGVDNVNLTLQANGLEKTRLRIGQPQRDWGGPAGENTTTAQEMGLLLEKVATGKILNERATREAVRLLSQEQQVAWLPALLPTTAKVAHKSGELPGYRHDAGIIYTPRNDFVVVMLTSDLGNYDEAAQSIARVAKAAFDYFETGGRK
ncbi:MAG: serine hydrolase [Sphingomonadaceae bacterium]